MYLSKMDLNMARRETLRLVGSPYRMHALVEHAFPPRITRTCEQGRILWRVDASPTKDAAVLYILSPERPDLIHAVEQAGWPLYPHWETKDYRPLLDKIAKGQVWQFRLKANPVRTVLVDKGRRENQKVIGTVQGHVTEAHQRQWLLDRSGSHGFRVLGSKGDAPDVSVSHRSRERFLRDGKTVTLITAQFDGILEVTDAKAFRHALGFGIGRAKGFGCGLLTIAPVCSK